MKAADIHPLAETLLHACSDLAIPLTASEFNARPLPADLLSTNPAILFPKAREARCALAGLLLFAGHWELSHQTAQDISTREGSYWHAIIHRIEPDLWNADYWFRRVGSHPIFADLLSEAAALAEASKIAWPKFGSEWQPKLFLDCCDEARAGSASQKELASRIQTVECRLLFNWCALK